MTVVGVQFTIVEVDRRGAGLTLTVLLVPELAL